MSTKGDENEKIYIFTGLYIVVDELETKINIFAFKIIWDHIKINMFKQIKLEAKILFRM